MSLPSAPNLGARSEEGFGALDVLVGPVLDPEVTDSSPLLPFDFSWLAGVLFAGVSLAALDQHSQYRASMVCDRAHKSWRLLGFPNLEISFLIWGRSPL